jgi:hypothetical protein
VIFSPTPRRRDGHASDDELAVLAFADFRGCDPAVSEHAVSCRECGLRLRALQQALADDRHEAIAEADRAFPAGRLEQQRANILRRIGGSRAVARILPFPAHGPHMAPTGHRVAWRPIAAAALTGLIVGTFAGRLLGPADLASRASGSHPPAAIVAPAASPPLLQASAAAEEAFLRDFEAAVGSPRVEPLRALDELTPHGPDDRVR